MKKFKTCGRSRYIVEAKIVEVEVERETENSVWVKGSRRAKVSDYDIFHDSWDDAHLFLVNEAEKNAQSARRDLERANGALGNVKGMKKPVGLDS